MLSLYVTLHEDSIRHTHDGSPLYINSAVTAPVIFVTLYIHFYSYMVDIINKLNINELK